MQVLSSYSEKYVEEFYSYYNLRHFVIGFKTASIGLKARKLDCVFLLFCVGSLRA